MSGQVLPHSCDGIEEYDNPLPRWWIYLFYFTIAFSAVYCYLYPSTWFWHGSSGWSQRRQYQASLPANATVAADPKLSEMAAKADVVANGKQVFSSNCASCHGLNAEGKIGPCLTDKDWKYGDSDTELYLSIRKGRKGGMPAWGTFLKPDQVVAVAAYVHSIGNTTAGNATAAPSATPAPVASASPTAASTPAP
jgi:cytochrome c oxidase cbb3-type subunit 3